MVTQASNSALIRAQGTGNLRSWSPRRRAAARRARSGDRSGW